MSKVVRCENGHFYDSEKSNTCPHCIMARLEAEKRKEQEKPSSFSQAENVFVVSDNKNHTQKPSDNRSTFSKISDLINKKKNKNEPEDEHNSHTMPLNQFHKVETDIPMSQSNNIEQSIVEQKSSSILEEVDKPAEKTEIGTLAEAIDNAGIIDKDDIKTVGFFGGSLGKEPMVGLLIAIAGPEKGKDYKLISGKNAIGRNAGMNVVITMDNKVSRERHACILYEPRSRKFYLLSAECNAMTYLNGEVLLENKTLVYGDRILIGDTELLFIPVCGENFSWDEEK